MSYISFDRNLMSNLDESLQREYLRTNRKGAYCSSSIVGCNTRKYHGILVVPLPNLSANNHVLLSSLDLSVIQHDAVFNTAIHEYGSGTFSPKGHKYIRNFNVDTSTSTIYRVGGVVLKKEMFFCHYEHRIIIKFSLLEANSRTTLQLRPFLAFRDVKMLTHKNNNINEAYQHLQNGVSFRLYDGYPDLSMQLSKDNRFVSEPYWNDNIAYFKEKERGYEYTEDLYVPGYFEFDIEKGEEVFFTAALEDIEVSSLANVFEKERLIRVEKEDFKSSLMNASQQFYYRPNEIDGYILAGYPWFGVRARDMLISLPGCSIFSNAPERFERVMHTFMHAYDTYIKQEGIDNTIRNLKDPDVGLWAIWSLQQYYLANNSLPTDYKNFISRIINYYCNNIHPNTRIDDTGLLYTQGDGSPLTWMDAKLDNVAVVKREGYIVEINALWYNALCFYREIFGDKGDGLDRLICKVEENFKSIFINKYDYLFDYVSYSGKKDWSVRPNMIFAVSLPYSPLSRTEQRAVLNIITRELLTPKGLRSLSPKSEGYRATFTGKQIDRELAYYNGSVWPWLLGAYFEAYIKIYGKSAISFIERTLIGMESEIQEHGVGTISELFDGMPPFKGRGAISFAMSVGEILRSLDFLEKAKSKNVIINPIIKYYHE